MRLKKYLVCIIIWVTVLLTAAARDMFAAPVKDAKTSDLFIQYSFTLKNSTSMPIPEAQFWTYAPVKKTAFQECTSFTADYAPAVDVDAFGNQILHFTVKDLAPFASRIITVQARLKMGEKPAETALKDPKPFLLPEKYIECTAPDVVGLAAKLKGRDSLQTARNVFEWVAGNLHYTGYAKNDRGALWALKKRSGDCTEFMYLFVALCRAAGVPARGVGGYLVAQNSIVDPADYHNWAEFYINRQWRIADPQKNIFMKHEPRYVAVHILSRAGNNGMDPFHRFRFSGRGLTVRMNKNG